MKVRISMLMEFWEAAEISPSSGNNEVNTDLGPSSLQAISILSQEDSKSTGSCPLGSD